jgi:hypothetical protein
MKNAGEKKMADEITIIIAERGHVPTIGDLANEDGEDIIYRITNIYIG